MQTPLEEILAAFGVAHPARIDPIGSGAWLVDAGSDTLVLREMKRRAPKAGFSVRALEHVMRSGLGALPDWRRDVQGELAVRRDHSTWLLSEWIPGHCALLGLEPDALAAARALGEFHAVAVGLDREDEPEPLDMYHRYLARCRDRARSLRTYSIMADYKLRRTAMDHEFLATVAAVISQAESAVAQLEEHGWAEMAAQSQERGAFAYRRVGRGGIVVTDDPKPRAVFVDWSGCRLDCHITDLARLVGRVIRSSGGDEELAAAVVETYAGTRPLSGEERGLLLPMLAFPDRYFDLARRYYEHKRDWPENTFVRYLHRVVRDLENQGQCVRALAPLLGG